MDPRKVSSGVSFFSVMLIVLCVARGNAVPVPPSVVLRPEVKMIDPSRTVYACPADDAIDEQTTAFILPAGNGSVAPNDVILSRQAGGMMHKVFRAGTLGTYDIFLARMAELEDVFEHVNVSESSKEVEDIERPETVESVPDPNLLESLRSPEELVPCNTSVIELRGTTKVWKCAGHVYHGENETFHVTFYLVIPESRSYHINVNDILIGDSSDGFLEQVTDVVSVEGPEGTMKLAHTELMFCGDLENSTDTFRIKEIRNTQYTSCVGGDGIPGLQIFQGRGSYSVGDVIPGRPSREFAVKILRRFKKDCYNFFEVTPVESVEDGEIAVESTGLTTDRQARRKRATFSVGKSFKATYPVTLGKVKLGCGTFKASAKAILRSSLRVSFTLGWSRPFLHRIKASFDASVTLRVTLRLDFQCRIQYTGPKKAKYNHPIDNRHLIGFCIPIWAGICIPAALVADLTVKYVLTAQAKGFVEVSLERTGSLDMAAGWSSSSGVFSSGPTLRLSAPAPTISGGLERDKSYASATLTVTPAIKLHIPNLKTIARILRAAGWWIRSFLRKIFGVTNQRRIQPILEFSVSAPLVGRAKVTACPSGCAPPKDKVKVEAHAGLPESIDGDLTVKVPLTSLAKTWKVFSIPGKHFDGEKCFASSLIICAPTPPRPTPSPPTPTPPPPTSTPPPPRTVITSPPFNTTTHIPPTPVNTTSSAPSTTQPPITNTTKDPTSTAETTLPITTPMQTTNATEDPTSTAETTLPITTPMQTTNATEETTSTAETTFPITTPMQTTNATEETTSTAETKFPITTPMQTTNATEETTRTAETTFHITTPMQTTNVTNSMYATDPTSITAPPTTGMTSEPQGQTDPNVNISLPPIKITTEPIHPTDPTPHVDYCALAPCLNGGVCVGTVNGFTCMCTAGFVGEICERKITTEPMDPTDTTSHVDYCAMAPCLNGGLCVETVDNSTCICTAGFGGEFCEQIAAGCPVPDPGVNASHDYPYVDRPVPVGTEVVYICNVGTTMDGGEIAKMIMCLDSGVYDGTPAECGAGARGWSCTCEGCNPQTFNCVGDPRFPECDCVNCDCDI